MSAVSPVKAQGERKVRANKGAGVSLAATGRASREALGTWPCCLGRAVILALNCRQRDGETESVFFFFWWSCRDMWVLVS